MILLSLTMDNNGFYMGLTDKKTMEFLKYRYLKIAGISILILVAVLLLLQWRAKYVIEEFLKRKIPSHLALSYDQIKVNILLGDISFENVGLNIKNRDLHQKHTTLKSKNIKIKGLRYAKLIFDNTIAVDALLLKNPSLNYYPYKYVRSKKAKENGVVSLLKTIEISTLGIQNGSFFLLQNTSDSVQVKIASYDFKLIKGTTNPKLVTEKIPIAYDSYELKVDSIYTDLGKYETITIGQFRTTETEFDMTAIHLKSKYSKGELSNHLLKERDYVNIEIPRVTLGKINFGFTGNNFGIKMDSIKILEPRAEIYRDKLLPDDMDPKRMYSEVLRRLPVHIAIDNISIRDGYLSYEEKLQAEQIAGILTFEQLHTNLENIYNHDNAGETKIRVDAKFMGYAPLALEWFFDVNSEFDDFIVSGSLNNLKANRLNTFLESNLGVSAKGNIQEMYFTFKGNSVRSKGEMQMKYEDFKFDVLNKDRMEINKLLTFVGNLFINDGSNTDEKGFRYGSIQVEREVDKSFFNYIWLNVRDGMVKTLSGSGERDEPVK